MESIQFTLIPSIGKGFINRTKLLNEIVSTLSNRKIKQGFALFGQRRIGKTSLLLESTRRLSKIPGVVPVYFSFLDLVDNSIHGFARAFGLKVIEAFQPALAEKFSSPDIKKCKPDEVFDLSRMLGKAIKPIEDFEIFLLRKSGVTENLINRTLNLTEELAELTKVSRVPLFFDEFPDIKNLVDYGKRKIGKEIINKIRTRTETYEYTIISVSGSIRRAMSMAITEKESPFYRQFIIKEVNPFDKKNTIAIIKRGIKTPITPEAMDNIYSITGGIPYYIQYLGKYLSWSKHNVIDSTDVEEAFIQFLKEEGRLVFSDDFFALSQREKIILHALAKKKRLSPTEIARRIKHTVNSVTSYLSLIEKKGIISREERGVYKFEDPVFERWIREVL